MKNAEYESTEAEHETTDYGPKKDQGTTGYRTTGGGEPTERSEAADLCQDEEDFWVAAGRDVPELHGHRQGFGGVGQNGGAGC